MSALAIAVSVSFGAPAAAQDTAASPAAQRSELTESILAAKERALGERFDASIRASLKARMEALSMEQLNSLARQGDTADLPSLLGSLTSDLVYTPVTPCRVFDSRPSQGGPGPIPANTQRNVFVAGTLGFEAQGGLAGGCGVPVGATSAIINFVTVLPAGPGNIRAWAVADPQPAAPLAAVLNYGTVAGLPAIANGVAVPLCNPAATSCTLGDLRLQADTSATNILGDVVGYFGPAIGSFVDLTTAQTVAGSKTFSSPIVGSVTGTSASVTGIVPIASGGTGSATQNFVDLTTAQTVAGSKTFSSPIVGSVTGTSASVTGIVPIANGGTGSATQIFVDLTTAQTVAGTKTFSSPIAGSVTGTAASVTGIVPIANGGTGSATKNFVDLTTAQAVAGNKTFSSLLSLGNNLELTGSTPTQGNITKGGSLFIHNKGSNSTAVGLFALDVNTGLQNTSTGAFSMLSNETGAGNTANGYLALAGNIAGSNNTAIGANALGVTPGGISNIGIGVGAGGSLTMGSSNIYIGNAGLAFESNAIHIGSASSGTGTTFIAGIRGVATGVANGVGVLIDSNGQLGTSSSSRRFKDDIADMNASSSALMRLRPVTFHYKTDQSPAGRTLQYGLIAEEVASVYPGLIAHSADGQIETVMYQFLPPMLLNEYQKQQRTIQAQAARLVDLEESRQVLAAELVSLKAQLGRLAELELQTARMSALLQSLAPPSASIAATSSAKSSEQGHK